MYGGVLVKAWRIGAIAVILVGLSGCEGEMSGGGGTPQPSLVERLSVAQIGGQQAEFAEGEAPEADDLDLSTDPSECLALVFPTLMLAGADLAEARLEGQGAGATVVVSAARLDSGGGPAVLEDLDGRVEPCSGSFHVDVSDDALQQDEGREGPALADATLMWEDVTPDRREWRVSADEGDRPHTDYVAAVDDSSVVIVMSSPEESGEGPDLSAVADDVLTAMRDG